MPARGADETKMTAPSIHRDAYIDLIKRSITNYIYLGGDAEFDRFRCVTHYDTGAGQWKIEPLARPATLLTRTQLDLVQEAIRVLEERKVPGDFIEAGIWRGGVIILMRALMNAYGITNRQIVASDSFAGIPKNVRDHNDPVDYWNDRWIASLEDVRGNIARFGLLDEKVEFLVGFFSDTLHTLAPDRRFALIRLDSDSYESVETSLMQLYPRLSPGGILIIDDWHLNGCKAAVMDYRAKHSVTEEIRVVEGNGYWVKAG
ncbi:MAG: macrocin O-methyltransferase [Alphaproteobacteria bacterium]|nr:MAG: macrocin O-methyltransferase [Alphaproteobacteria bacterium]